MSDVLAVVVGIIGFITIFAIAVYACFTETFKAIDEMIAEHIKSNADQRIQDVESVEPMQTKRDGEDQGADFIRITVWGRQAETCDRYLAKGRQVAVHGRIQTGSYKDRNGETVYTTDVVADRVEFLGSAGGENSASGGRNQQNGRTAQAQNNASQNGNFGGFSAMDEDVPWS